MSGPHQHTVRVQALDGTWETLGADRYRGVVPEGLTCSANRWGPDTCSFSLRRSAVVLGPDISTWTPCEIEVAGMVVWDGRIRATPTSESDGPVITVQGQGWQYHLDDDIYDRVYAHTRLTDWRDVRSFPLADKTKSKVAGQVTPGEGVIVLGWPAGTVLATNDDVGVMLDLGPGNSAQRIVVNWASSNNDGNSQLELITFDAADFSTGANALVHTAMNTGATGVARGTDSGSRYFCIRLQALNAHTLTADLTLTIAAAQVFASTAYESSDASVLTADQVVNDALDTATLLSGDRSEIQAGTFPIPELAVTDQTPRGAITAANAYENYETKMLIGRRFAFRPRPSVPIYEIGAWAGAEFQDASAGSGDDIVNRFVVRGAGPDGTPMKIDRRSSDIGVSTLADRRGFLHTRTASPTASITPATGARFADLYLKAYSTAPFAGSFRAIPGGVRRVLSGAEPHPAWLLRDTGQLVRCSDRVDPDTAGWGRAGEIDTVTYTADTLTADVALNENRAGLDTLLARHQIVVGQRAA